MITISSRSQTLITKYSFEKEYVSKNEILSTLYQHYTAQNILVSYIIYIPAYLGKKECVK